MTTEWHPAIASVIANGEMRRADFYEGQTKALGDLLIAVAEALHVPFAGPNAKGDLVASMWLASDILETAQQAESLLGVNQ